MSELRLGIKLSADGAGNVTAELTKVDGALNKLDQSAKSTSQSLASGHKGLEQYAIGLGKLTIGFMSVQQAAAGFKSVIDATAQMDRLRGMMEASTGSATAAAQGMQFVQQTSKTLGISLVAATDGFAQLTAAARGTSLQGQATNDIFLSVSKASAALGKSAEDTSSMITALSQMISKGTVSMEELRGQLGDRLPGAFQLAARAMGVTTQELDKMVSSGQVMADQLLPKLAKALDETYSNARFDRLNNNIARLDNAWTQLKGNIMDSDGMSKAIGLLAESLEGWGSTVKTPSLEERINEQIKAITQLENSTKRYQYLYRDGVEKEIASRKKMLELLIAQQKIENIRTKDAEIAPAKSALDLSGLDEQKKRVAQIVIDTAKAYKVDPAFALAIAEQESGFNQLAVSAKKAHGVMQLMPDTAKQLGVDFTNLNDNIKGGVLYLAQQEKQFKSLRLASAAYNAGPGNVQKYGGVPPFKETQNYVTSVGSLYDKWQKVLGVQGEAFISAKDQADETANAYKRIQTHQDDAIKRAEDYARVQVETIKTQLASMDQEREASARLTAEQLAGAKTYADKAAIIADAQQKADDYNARALDMVRAEFDAQQKAIEARKQAYETELAQADKYNVSIDEQFKLKRAIRSADTDLMLLAQNRAQAEINAAGKVNDFAKQSADLKRGEADAIANATAEFQRQFDILDRLTRLKEQGANADQLAMLNDVYQSTGNLPEIVSAEQLQKLEQLTMGVKVAKAAVDDLTGAQKKNQEQAVKERQLRENEYWDQTIERMKRAGAIWTELLGQQADGFADLAVSVTQFGADLSKIEAKYRDIEAAGKDADENGRTRFDETAQAVAQVIGETSLAMRKMFDEGSDGYKAMTALAGAAAIAQDAINIQKGIGAVLQQLEQGDPYTAIPRAIAVAGMVAQLIGHAVSLAASMGGGSSTIKAEDRQKTQGTGTVFGDPTAQSASIANSLEIIKSNSTNDLNYSAAMLRALEDLSNSILALANQVTMNVMPSIDEAIQASGMKFGKQNISLFSGFNTQVTDSGIGWFEASLSRILKGDFTAKMYADITKSFEVMGSAISESTKTYVRDASSEVSNQIIMIFRDIVKAFEEGVKAFGLTTDSVLTALKGFKVGMEQISLKDMTMEEQTAALNAVFSKITDQMAGVLNKRLGLALGPFRQAGEGMAETFFRVSEGISRAQGEMEKLGLTAIDYKDIIAKQGDVAAEITRQTLLTQTDLADGIKAYVNELTGSADDIISAYKQLVQARNSMVTAGFGDANLDRTMINAAGGLDAFVSAMESFNENFLSQADRYAGDVRVLSEQFGKLGYDLPASKEEFVKLAFSLNDGTESGKKLFGQMIALSDAFAKVADQAENIRAKYANILDPFKSFSDQIRAVGEDFSTLIGGLTGDSTGRINTITANATAARNPLLSDKKTLQASIDYAAASMKQLDDWQKQLSAELEKSKKQQDKKLIANLKKWIAEGKSNLAGWQEAIVDANAAMQDVNLRIAAIDAQEGIDKAAELARLSVEKQGIIADAQRVMSSTLEDVFNGIVQAVQQAQQRLESVIAVQKSLASQLAQLQGPGAVFNLASANRNEAFGAIDQYIAGVKGGGARDVATEVSLLQTAQQAVMDKYNAEIAAIQEAEQAFIAAETERLNAALQLQIDAINARTEAAIKAENDRLNAAVKAQQKIDEQALKSQQKQFDAANKLTQKAFDAEQKALQKIHDEKLQALQDEMDAANKLADAIKSIADYAAGMRLGQNSTLSPEARLAEAQRQYQELQAKASGGDAEAMQRLTGASDAYLEAAKTYYGSSTNYQDIFDGVQRAMESIGGMSAPDPDSIQSRIDQLREAQAEEMDALRELQAEKLDAIREGQQDQLDAIREQQQGSIDAMREASQAQQDAIRKAAQSQIESLQKATQQAIADLSDPTKNRAMAEAKAAAERDMKELQRLAELSRIEAEAQAKLARDEAARQAEAAWKLANDQLMALGAANGLSAATLAALNKILEKNAISQVPVPAYAKGGMAQPGLALVGEQGPELVRFNRPGQVYTAQETKSLLGNDEKVVKAIEALKAEMRAVAVTQSNANPEIIAELREMKDRLNQIERTNKLAATSK